MNYFIIAAFSITTIFVSIISFSVGEDIGRSEGIIEYGCWGKNGIIISDRCVMEAK